MTSEYYILPNGIECKDVEGWFPTAKGKAISYIWRSGKKPGADEVEDLRKAIDHINFEIERIQKFAAKVEKKAEPERQDNDTVFIRCPDTGSVINSIECAECTHRFVCNPQRVVRCPVTKKVINEDIVCKKCDYYFECVPQRVVAEPKEQDSDEVFVICPKDKTPIKATECNVCMYGPLCCFRGCGEVYTGKQGR
jgi:hypothetical protein